MPSFAMSVTIDGKVAARAHGPFDPRPRARRACGWLLAAWIVLPALTCRAQDPLDDYRLAVGFYNKEQWKLAAESFQTFLKKNAQHARAESARYFYGLTLIKLDDVGQARDVLRAFVKDFPKGRDVVSAGYWIGHCSYHLEDYAAAEKELAAFVKNAPNDRLLEWALPFLGDVELRLRKPESALSRFQEAIKAYPEGELADDAKFGVARSYDLLGKAPEAAKAYREIATNRSGARAAEAQLNLGALEFDAGRFAEAASAYETIERLFPGSPLIPLAQLNQGFARYQLGQYPQAIAQFDKAGTTEKYAAEAALWKGLSLKAQAELAEAVEVLQAAYLKHRDQPLAEKLLFQLADCEQRRGSFDKARTLFLEVVERWPRGPSADESLHAACQAAVNGDNLAEAERLITRFDREYPRNRLRLRQEILRGRVLAAKNDWAGAAKHFRTVIDTTEIEATGWQARYYLADALQKRKLHAEVLEVTAPLAALWDKGPGPAEFAGVLVVRAASLLELARAGAAAAKNGETASDTSAQCKAAVESAGKYLSVAPHGPLAAQARLVRTVAQALAAARVPAQESLAEMRKNHPGSPELDQTLYELGTIAYAREDWEWAQTLFAELAARPKDSRLHSRAQADLGWTEYKRKKFLEASATFARLLGEHPGDALAGEAAFMRASALQDGGKVPEAQAAFAEAFRRSESSDHVFLAGLQSARLLVQLKKLVEADAVYEELLTRFDRRADADKVLDAWATVHYNAENFAKADELFGRLVRDYPGSPLADNAQLVLAESELFVGRLDEARRSFQTLAKSPRSDEVVQQRSLYQLMQIELETKRWDELRKICQESLARFPAGAYHWDAEWRWADADFRSGAYKPSAERLAKLIARKDDETLRTAKWYPQVWVLLAESQFKLKDHEAVAATVAEFRAWDEKSSLVYQADEVLGRSLKAQAKWPEARQAFVRVLGHPDGKSTETAARSQFHIAETYHFEKNYQAALKEYLTVDILYEFPEWQAAALLGAAGCQENLGQLKEAAKAYDDVLRTYSKDEGIAVKAREGLERVRRRLAAG